MIGDEAPSAERLSASIAQYRVAGVLDSFEEVSFETRLPQGVCRDALS